MCLLGYLPPFLHLSLKDLGQQLLTNGQFALEFEKVGRFKHKFIRFWKDDSLVKALLCRYGLQSPPLAGEMGSLSRILSAVSTRPQLVGVSGCPSDFIQTVDDSGFFQHTLQSPFRFETVNLQSIINKDSRSVFERVDLFSVLQNVVVSLGRGFPWGQFISGLDFGVSRVNQGIFQFLLTLSLHVRILSSLTFEAIIACKLELVTLPLVCHELLAHWTQVSEYL